MKTFMNFEADFKKFLALCEGAKDNYIITGEAAMCLHGCVHGNSTIEVYVPNNINFRYTFFGHTCEHIFCDRLSILMIKSSKLLAKHTPMFVNINGYRVLSKPALKIFCKEMIAFGGDKVRDKYEKYLALLSPEKLHITDSGMFTGCIPTIKNKVQTTSSVVQ